MNRLKNLWDTIRHINMYIMKIPEGPEKKNMLNAPPQKHIYNIFICTSMKLKKPQIGAKQRYPYLSKAELNCKSPKIRRKS